MKLHKGRRRYQLSVKSKQLSLFELTVISVDPLVDCWEFSYSSDVGRTGMRVKTGRDIDLSCTRLLIDRVSVRVRDLETPRPYVNMTA
jgi:hypothetical protein